ncbi:cleavage and polyadenylation specificity factor subunit 3-II [Gossypium australe]|uniref:Cleavage and polyadenylation specificity factor subunit 3-II n=1 Tax=Gossypium australe TaxID=47621 RepID=A0A5B6V346_9ROSI|nr:cleavage and polyadenylation specificity factor subunit 3-II [Gossypium australe]
MAIDCLVLGAGQEVGKSCMVVSINGKRIMFDCGMHMGYSDSRRYPDFSLISRTGDFDNALTCVIYPTKALAPLMLEDYRKNMDRRGEDEQFTSDHIAECMKKVIPVDLKQTVQVDKDLQIRAYYAGHVIGAAMFYAKVGDAAMVHNCVAAGGKVLIPTFALGRAQV